MGNSGHHPAVFYFQPDCGERPAAGDASLVLLRIYGSSAGVAVRVPGDWVEPSAIPSADAGRDLGEAGVFSAGIDLVQTTASSCIRFLSLLRRRLACRVVPDRLSENSQKLIRRFAKSAWLTITTTPPCFA